MCTTAVIKEAEKGLSARNQAVAKPADLISTLGCTCKETYIG